MHSQFDDVTIEFERVTYATNEARYQRRYPAYLVIRVCYWLLGSKGPVLEVGKGAEINV